MSNTILTPTAVTREILRIAHQKANFIGTINRQYDDSFAQSGAKIGDSLKIREPNQYTVTSGATMSTQNTSESSVTLQITSQKHVAVNFTSEELTLKLDDFSKRILEPAVSTLTANVEADALSMYKDVYNQVNNTGSAATLAKVLAGRKILNDNLAPNSGRTANLNTQDNVDLVDALKGLFQDSTQIAKQYKEGMMGRTSGFDFYENTLIPSHTVGTKAGTPLVNGATQTGASLITDGWTASSAILKKGDIFTLAGVFRVHPESKATTSTLQQFVVTADVSADGTGNATLAISPSIVTSGAKQNVSGSPADNAAITVVGTASTAHGISLLYHEDAFTFATADLVMPKGVHFAARENFDGISMRVVQAFDINNDKLPCRIDILYGYKTLRAPWACRAANN